MSNPSFSAKSSIKLTGHQGGFKGGSLTLALAPQDQTQVRPDRMLSNQVSRKQVERAKTLPLQSQEQSSTSTARFELLNCTTPKKKRLLQDVGATP